MQTIYNGLFYLPMALEGSKKVLLVVDSSFHFLNIKNDVEGIDVPYVKFSNFTSNPLYEDVCKGVELFNAEKCDTILAVGGGSTIDVAKCIKLFCKMPKDNLFLNQEYKETNIKLIALPTTAGTGSESTRYAVIYYDGRKQSVTHDSIIPNIAILVPKVLSTLPLYQKKSTMLDALCQSIESWWSVNSTESSIMLSKKAIETITKWWRKYIFEKTDESAEHIMKAANWAGQAICITQTTAPHAFSYKLSSLYHLPHGHAVAIAMPEIWNYMINHPEKCIDSRGSDYLIETFSQISKAMGVANGAENAVIKFRQILDVLDIRNPVSNNIDYDADLLLSYVNPIRLKNNPIVLDKTTIRSLYMQIIHSSLNNSAPMK